MVSALTDTVILSFLEERAWLNRGHRYLVALITLQQRLLAG
jgi:hypothetical protein